MKKLFLALTFLSAMNYSFAQTFTIQNDSVTVSGLYPDALADTTYYTVQLTNHLHNLSNNIVPSLWTRDIQYLTTGWSTNVCDPVNCWGDTVDTENFDFPAGMNALVVVDYKPHGHAGMGVVKIKYATQANSSDSASAVFIGILDIGSSVVTVENLKNIKIFPNPANENFMVAANDEMMPVDIEVYDILGKRMDAQVDKKSTNLFAVNINNCKDGIYFLRLKMKDNSIITKRFTKS